MIESFQERLPMSRHKSKARAQRNSISYRTSFIFKGMPSKKPNRRLLFKLVWLSVGGLTLSTVFNWFAETAFMLLYQWISPDAWRGSPPRWSSHWTSATDHTSKLTADQVCRSVTWSTWCNVSQILDSFHISSLWRAHRIHSKNWLD